MTKNNSITLKLDQFRKNLRSQNEMFRLSSKILNEMVEKRKTRGDKRGLDYLSESKTP